MFLASRATLHHAFPAETVFLRWIAIAVPQYLTLGALAAMALLFGCGSAGAHGTFHEVEGEVREKLKSTPDDPKLYYRLAEIYQEHGEWQQALLEIEHVDRLSQGQIPTDLVRGQALKSGGKVDAAKAVFDDFLIAHADHPIALLERARVMALLKNLTASLADYRAALKATAKPEPDLFQEVAVALAASELNDEAVAVLQSGLVKVGNVPSLVLKAMELEVATGRFDDALKRIDAMQANAPRPEPWMAKRAALLAQAGRANDAQSAWSALRDHILALPNLERGSHSMSRILEEAQTALKPSQTRTITTAIEP